MKVDVIRNPNRTSDTTPRKPEAPEHVRRGIKAPDYFSNEKEPRMASSGASPFSTVGRTEEPSWSQQRLPKSEEAYDEYVLMIRSKVVFKGTLEETKIKINNIINNLDPDYQDDNLEPDDFIVLKRMNISFGINIY